MAHAFDEHIGLIEDRIGYVFHDKSLLAQAFTRTSFCNEQSARDTVRRQSNEVLEFFGDSILSAAIVSLLIRDHSDRYLFGIRTDLTEGDLSNIKSRLSDKKNLSKSMQALGLQIYLRMGEGDTKLGVENEPSVMEDLFESIIGAIYIDCGMHMEPVMSAVRHMLDVSEYLHPQPSTALQSDKNALQEFCADRSRRLPPPVYEAVSEEGPEHMRVYTRACRIGDRICGVGQGKNRKAADTAAARAALAFLRQEEAEGHAPTAVAAEDAIRSLAGVASRRRKAAPDYLDLGRTEDLASAPQFACECRFDGRVTKATGPSKREAKRMAAEQMLQLIEK